MSIDAALLGGFVVLGAATVVHHLWKAFRTGEVDEEIWFGASNADDHYGFAIRILGLFVMLGLLIWLGLQIPDIIAASGNDV